MAIRSPVLLCLFLQVARHHGQGDVAVKASETMVRAAVEAVSLKGVDGRLDDRMTAAQTDKVRIGFRRFEDG